MKSQIPLSEKLKSIPEIFGIRLNEEPNYRVVRSDSPYEVRRYGAQLRASVTLTAQNFDQFRERAFEVLADYIFGENVANAKIAMTSPVLNESSHEISMTAPVLERATGENAWTMSFILPSKFNIGNVPHPKDSRVQLEEVPEYEVAVLRYSGNNSVAKIQSHERQLTNWVNTQSNLTAQGPCMSAQYDAPFVLPFLKTNEVQMPVSTMQS